VISAGSVPPCCCLEPFDAGGNVKVDQLLEHRRRGQILEAAEGWLAGQGVVFGPPLGDELEDRIVAQGVVIVAVLIAGEDAEDPLAEHGHQRLVPLGRRIGQASGHTRRVPPAVIKLAERQQSGVGSQLPGDRLDQHRDLWEKIKLDLRGNLAG
jgi:hypothetical protein